MKATYLSSLVVLGLGTSAFAGETTARATYSAPPSEAPSLWTWFIGGSAGYLMDSEEEFYTLHLGMKIAESGPVAHALFIEGAYTELAALGIEREAVRERAAGVDEDSPFRMGNLRQVRRHGRDRVSSR